MAGCITTRDVDVEWPLPEKPTFKSLDYLRTDDGGLYVDENNAINLLNNIEDMKAYNKKLEVLIKRMQKYYK